MPSTEAKQGWSSAMQDPKKYCAYLQSKGSLRELVGQPTMDENSVATADSGKIKVPSGCFGSVHRVDEGFHRVRSSTSPNLQILQDMFRLHPWNISVSKSAGPDENQPAIIRPLADLFTGPICNRYKTTLQPGYLPRD